MYDPVEHRHTAVLYGQDPRASAPAWLAWPLLAMGYPVQAMARHGESLARAQEAVHPNTLAQVLYCGCVFRQLLGDLGGVRERAEALVSLATQHAFPFWRAMATILEGWVLARTGDPERAGPQIQGGLAAYREMGAEIWLPYFLALLAEVRALAGDVPDACRLLDEALDQAARTGERWFEAELHRLRGELLLLRARVPDADEAEACFVRAIDGARTQRAKWWELRAALSLARLWRDRGKRAEARDLLAPVYGWFTEGFDTLDLQEAKALLEALR